MRIGVMGAMLEEIQKLIAELGSAKTVESHGMREYHRGSLWGADVVLVFSRWGKVAAASTVSSLISKYGVDRVLFTGVAGGVSHSLRLGDIVVGDELVQHDMDARPLFARHEVPLIGKSRLRADPEMTEALASAARRFAEQDFSQTVRPELQREFKLPGRPRIQRGLIASGDKFFASQEDLAALRAALPDTLCVEMEGASVAQVCHEHGVPFAIVRTISDSADEHAPVNFPKFLQSVATEYSHGILKEYFLNK